MSLQLTSERQVEERILNYLSKLKDGFFWKNVTTGYFDGISWRQQTSPFAIKGTSDILGIYKGKFVAIEVKAKNGKPSKEQLVFIAKIQKMGGVAGIARSVEDAQSLLQSAFGHVLEEKTYETTA